MKTHTAVESYELLEDGRMVIRSQQELGADYWANLKEAQEEFSFRLNGLTPVASIPEVVVDKWIREGFDFWNAPAREIQLKLRLDDMPKFLVTDKKF